MSERASRTTQRRSERSTERSEVPAAAHRPRVRTSSRVSGGHDAGQVPVGAATPTRLWRGGGPRRPPAADTYEHEARALGPRLSTRARPAAAASGPQPLRARPAPRPDPALGAGRSLSSGERARFEPALGVDLSPVRVHDGFAAKRAAAARQAHAFTFGNHVVLGPAAQDGGSGPRAAVLAHELVHVRQQAVPSGPIGASRARGPPGQGGFGPSARAPPSRAAHVQCWDASDLVPGFVSDAAGAVADAGSAAADVVVDAGEAAFDWVLDGVKDAARALPGYDFVSQIIGRDPITQERVTVERTTLVDALLTYGPFGPAVAAALDAADVIGDVFTALSDGLVANRLTLDRILGDIDSAFSEFTLSNGVDANLAIVRRYVDAFLADVVRFVTQIAERVIEIVRSVVATLAEPLLQTEAIRPVWQLVTQVLHYDPLRGVEVQTPTVEILANFLRLIGKQDALEQMQERGTLQATADWLDAQVATFTGLLVQLTTLFSNAWAAISPANLPHLLDNLASLAQDVFSLVQGVAAFAVTVVAKVLELVKTSLLAWLAGYANQVPGFHMITVIIGRNPFTGEVVPRTAENIIRGFISLLPGGEAMYASLAESGVIAAAAERIESAMTTLGITSELVIATFLGVWDLVTLENLLDPLGTFRTVVDLFGDPIRRIVAFVAVVIEVVITLVLRLMNFPVELIGSIITNTVAAITDIQRDPVGFLLNMIEAIKAGFVGFFSNIATHLLQGLVDWLFRGLGQLGITIPSEWSLAAALDLVLQVLGLSMDFLWRKLGEHIGEERVALIRENLDRLAGAWAFISDVQQRGLAAIWDYVSDQLSSLWQTVLSMATEWIMTRVIASATTKLLSMLDPTGVMAVINSAIAFFNAVQSAIEYLRDMLEIVNMYVSTLAAVAAGNIEPGARMIEQGLAAVIPIAIGFLANQVGLGNMPERIVEIIQRLREMVERAVDWLITQALRLGQAALDALGMGGDQRPDDAQPPPVAGTGPKHQAQAMARARLTGQENPDEIEAVLAAIKTELTPAGLHDLALRGPDAHGGYEVVASASDYERLAALVPRLSGPRAVRMRATLHTRAGEEPLAGATSLLTAREAVRDETGGVATDENGAPVMETVGHGLAPVVQHTARVRGSRPLDPKLRSGGAILPPEPGASRLEVLTYNTSDDPQVSNNATHAERQLLDFLERDRPVARRVERIEAQINWSPCTLCTPTLSRIADATPNATTRVIHWQTLYAHPDRGTTDASLGSISGWVVDPATTGGDPPEGVDLEALTWPELPAEV